MRKISQTLFFSLICCLQNVNRGDDLKHESCAVILDRSLVGLKLMLLLCSLICHFSVPQGVGNTLKKHYETYLLEYELAHNDVDGECCILCHRLVSYILQ